MLSAPEVEGKAKSPQQNEGGFLHGMLRDYSEDQLPEYR
jgi:hypothetical protein